MAFFLNITSVSTPPSGPLVVSFTTTTPRTTRGPPRPLQPATHLQLRWAFPAGTEAFTGEIVPETLRTSHAGDSLTDVTYHLDTARKDMPRVRVGDAGEGVADVTLFVWKGVKVLGQWPVGKVEGLGLEKDSAPGV